MMNKNRRFSASKTSLLPQTQRSPASSRVGHNPNGRGSAPADGSIHSVARTISRTESSVAEKYSLGLGPETFAAALNEREPDDMLHDPRIDTGSGSVVSYRALTNIGCLAILVLGILMLFAGYPILSTFLKKEQTTQGGFNLGGINSTGQIPYFPNKVSLIDPDTPKEAMTIPGYEDPTQTFQLVFSDEFNVDGRSFYPGDDPFWEAVDLHYWGTVDLEWYDPMQATTSGGSLRLRIDQVSDVDDNHNLTYRSGMIQSWNKFCFTGGILEASVTLPGSSITSGLWPALWSMGNLGRAGYGASLEGMWPYSYDTCDVGTLAAQLYPGTQTPVDATVHGDGRYDGVLSILPGQKLSACTCPGESHPGPVRKDGTYVGRASPEIDVFEAIVDLGVGSVSLSSQWAPFNARYRFDNSTGAVTYHDNGTTIPNGFVGGARQQTTSGLAKTNQQCYEKSGGCFAKYAFEYKTGFDDGYITWVQDSQHSWTLRGPAMGPDTAVEIGTRPISQEPMYIIANVGISPGFGTLDFENLEFPAVMSIDYIRVYQPPGAINVGCDPQDFPTKAYIEAYIEAYTNPNLTVWGNTMEGGYNQNWPKNRLKDQC